MTALSDLVLACLGDKTPAFFLASDGPLRVVAHCGTACPVSLPEVGDG